MIVFENEFSAIIRQTQTIYDCNRLPSLCSNLLRPFDPLKDYSCWGDGVLPFWSRRSGHNKIGGEVLQRLLTPFFEYQIERILLRFWQGRYRRKRKHQRIERADVLGKNLLGGKSPTLG